jgi:glycosidase
MIESMKYWVKEFDVDGFRCDVADYVPVDFWNEARKQLDEIKPVFMLAEAENPEHHKKAFDMSYGWEFHHIMNQIAKGEKKLSAIHEYFERNRFQPSDYRMQFTSNHDENSWNGTETERFGKHRLIYAVLASTIEGMPLVYSGQEADFNRRLKFFDKDQIDWGTYTLNTFYTKLLQLNKENEALWNGNHGGQVKFETPKSEENILIYSREKNGKQVVVLLNFSDKKQTYTIQNDFVAGSYKSLFEKDKKVRLKKSGKVTLDGLSYKVYYK